ncbi:MAG: NHL repeat-containing protein [Janthinobacterium lividum]
MHFLPLHFISTQFYHRKHRSLALGFAALCAAGFAPAATQAQDLYVGLGGFNSVIRFAGTGAGTYASTSTTLSDTSFSLSGPQGMAFDSKGDLFVANQYSSPGSITEYQAGAAPGTFGASTVLSSSTMNEPYGLAFDSSGDLFATNKGSTFGEGSITEFMATGPGTFAAAVKTLTSPSLNEPTGLAFDANGDLFAADSLGLNGQNSVTEFVSAGGGTFGASAVTLNSQSLYDPQGVTVDAKGDLFVANYYGNSITEFAAGLTAGTFQTPFLFAYGSKLDGPTGLAFDSSGNLFVANEGTNANNTGTVTEITFTASGDLATNQIIESGLAGPAFLAFGPSASNPVPEASTTVSFGLLLALGLGGLAVAKRRQARKPN